MYSEQKEALAQEIELKRPAVLAVSGLHNSGKTTLLEKLLPALRSRGLKVGIIKHDGHDFTPDVPGTDSYRLREAGAEGVAVYSGQRYLLTEMFRLTEQDLLALFERHGYDLVLLDPPYGKGVLQRVLPALVPRLSDDAMVVCESGRDEELPAQVGSFVLDRERRHGKTKIALYLRGKDLAE